MRRAGACACAGTAVVGAADAAAAAASADAAEGAEAEVAAESAEGTESAESAEGAEGAEPTEPVEPAEPAEPPDGAVPISDATTLPTTFAGARGAAAVTAIAPGLCSSANHGSKAAAASTSAATTVPAARRERLHRRGPMARADAPGASSTRTRRVPRSTAAVGSHSVAATP
ncbi:MAG TPA: hypothetical protein PLZ50_08935 [Rubrivivax sp.]|nr:hypothetical protein [Rubrivivax sp.]